MAGLDPRAVPGDDSRADPRADGASPGKLVPDVPTIARARAARGDVFDRLWRLLCSVRFAILLISLAATGVLAGTLIMQAPLDAQQSAETFDAWLARPQARYGPAWHAIFAALDLYRVFSAFWWRALLAVLTLSVVICTINRAPGIMASIRRPAVKVPARLFEKAPLQAEFRYSGVSPEQVQVQAAKVLAARRFRVITGEEGEARTLFADRNRFGKAGTFLNHIGIVTVLAAGVLGGVLGWRDNAFMVPEGSTRAVGRETGLVVRNEGFTDEYFPSGTAKDYRSDLVVLQDGQEVARKTIRVNDPLDVAGVRFHQAFFGPAAVMRVRDPQGNVIFEDGVALGYQFDGTGIPRNGGFFVLGNRQMAVYVLVPAAQRGPDPEIPAGNVRLEIFLPRQARPSAVETLPQGTPREILGYTFEFVRERQFSGLQVVHNPAMNLIWFAAGCMLLGVLAVFNFPLRRVWARTDPGPEGVRLRLASVSNRDVLFAREFERLALTVDQEVTALVRETSHGTVEGAVHALH
ncbi:MAG TPA: cytochrome c biogenesis protein ResB [Chloroflexota bacterium]|nr:cytochrome c biogenesis protein ResB [Chloroflexota bacterium]